MHPPNLGYVPREVGLLGYLLELRRSSLRELSCDYPFLLILSHFIPVLRLLRGIHGLTRPIQLPLLNLYLRCHVHDSLDRLLHVRSSHLQVSSP